MPLFASTILLSAFLLFLVQPIIAKQILPWFGGTSAVWITCLVFFQVVLLAGYTYAHVITRRLDERTQSWLHIALLLASLLFLPVIPNASLKPEGGTDAALHIIVLLLATIGLPYFLLSTTGPLLQKWVAPQFPEKSVYRLFALSNFGSLVGLLAFPFAIEPFSSSSTQSMVWSAFYALFVACCGVSAWKVGRRMGAPHALALPEAPATPPPAAPRPSASDVLLWLAFSTLGSVMLLASTSHITQNIASVPFLWVLPLSLYLLTFVIAFEGRGGRGWYEQKWWLFITLVLIVAMAAGLSLARGVLDISVAVPLYTFGMFMAVLFCNGELAHRKPAPRYLTHFYLTISLGGALGGLFVGLVAPRIFPAYFELPLALLLLAALAVVVVWRNAWLVGPAIIATLATGWYGIEYVGFVRNDVVYIHRNFYGMLRVREQGTGDFQVRRLLHGVILHGEQFTINPDRLEPNTYYARTSGVGRAIAARQAAGPVRIGVVGLGVGTLSAYGRAGDVVRFYELDPDVLQLSRRYFDFLNASPAQLEFVIGDARLSMERELAQSTPQKFDVLAIDAFSSDSIPVHLITRQAIAMYMRQLAPGGVLAVHISNRFLDLKPVLANIGSELGLQVRLVADKPPEPGSTSDWVLISANAEPFSAPELDVAEALEPVRGLSLWTDQFNNLLDVLKAQPIEALKHIFEG
ncbi:MAG TPA: fused MFS/spermidine synthase [Burkholderiaceae bacterium]|nr:fused MFS/spermidine synthase [Burkholderiaceae bacterium]